MATAEKSRSNKKINPDHGVQKKRVNRIKGQIDGIERMIDDRRYCVDILNQIKAARSALSSLEAEILKTHLRHCIQAAFQTNNAFDVDQKIQEIIELI